MRREQQNRREQGERLKQIRLAAGFRSARSAARQNRWPESSYRAHEKGTRTIGQDDAERYAKAYRAAGVPCEAKDILFGAEENMPRPSPASVVVKGRLGAGAVIEPEFEQVPEDGFYPVDLPFAVPDEMIAFEVVGDSMLPRYDEGDVIVVWERPRRPTESFVGEEAAVRTHDGRRYLKTILSGPTRGTYTLASFNAKPIVGVRIVWVGEIFAAVRAKQVKRMEAQQLARGRGA